MKKLLFLLVFALLLTACGGTDAPSTTINVTMTDFAFSPNTFTVPAGQPITINATNNGASRHTFVIMKLGKDVGQSFIAANQADIYWQTFVDAGGNKSDTFTAPSTPGEYQIICDIPGHYEAGMSASLIVK